ncbi:MAG: hypothetical protein KatS3mg097_058 [Candidatus Parcubacteria bacterium]|nr:MAG: hypothetical protein KatS3mg097_058 [Candidatus Parcubacteria bacterium]
MKTKIIPAINAQSFEEIKEKVNILKDSTQNFHLDVAEKSFTGYETWRNYNDLDRLELTRIDANYGNNRELMPTDDNDVGNGSDGSSHKFAINNSVRSSSRIVFDIHLMIPLKPQEILKWAKENVKRLILHLEASSNPDGLLKLAKKTKKEIFIGWSPKITFDFIKKYLDFVNGVLILGVNPGRAGQSFLEDTYNRLAFIKKKLKKNQKLMIDGGINQQNLRQILTYEPDFIIMASAIYNTEDPFKTYLGFIEIIKNYK